MALAQFPNQHKDAQLLFDSFTNNSIFFLFQHIGRGRTQDWWYCQDWFFSWRSLGLMIWNLDKYLDFLLFWPMKNQEKRTCLKGLYFQKEKRNLQLLFLDHFFLHCYLCFQQVVGSHKLKQSIHNLQSCVKTKYFKNLFQNMNGPWVLEWNSHSSTFWLCVELSDR